jgi:hypothetical protein
VETKDTNAIQQPKKNLWGCLTAKVGEDIINFKLNIKLPHSLEQENRNKIQEFSTISSDSTKILHYLCGGDTNGDHNTKENMSDNQILTYNTYYTYQCAVRRRISQLISTAHNVESFPYQIIDCVRISPTPCKTRHILRKRQSRQNKLFKCNQCNMDLCVGGCCRIYHGETDCTLNFDEASDEVLKKIAENCKCPKCNAPVEKLSGCNHMTCTCKTQFCYMCKAEFEKDKYNRYIIDEPHDKWHFSFP